MPPRTPLWPLEPHTRGKHLVLRNYLDVWLPILGQSQERILFVDAFSGPGEYLGHEEGSPLIALRALTEHKARSQMRAEILFKFIEKDPDRSNYLDALLHEKGLMPSRDIEIINSTFDDTLTSVLDRLEENNDSLEPAFVMIDPFGFSDTPMELIGRILRNAKAEVYISFMYSFINRFDEHPELEPHFDSLYGSTEWRPLARIGDPEERKHALYDLYERRLRESGAKYVLHFELYRGQSLEYAIFFGTGGLRGCDEMKKAIWKVAPSGDFRFRGSQVDQLFLGDEIVDFDLLQQEIRQEFSSGDWTPIQEIEDFVMSDRTGFHSGHLREKVLIPMEEENRLEAKEGSRRRAKTYPDGTLLRFVEPESVQGSLL